MGGIRFQWDELEQASVRLDHLAEGAREVAAALVYVELELGQDIPPAVAWQSGAGAGLLDSRGAACSAVRDAARAVLADEDNLTDAARRITASRFSYLAADAAAQGAIARVSQRTEEAARAAAAVGIASGILRPGPVRITPPQDVGTSVPFEGTVGSLITRIAAVEERGPGTFEVLRTAGLEGPVYIVVLPGTQGSGLEAGNPFVDAGNAEAVLLDSRYVGPAVARALEDSGAQPGDRLMVAGYSQGGLHAMNLAADSGLAATYDVGLVVTVGSPTGWEGSVRTEYLHLEHANDAVHGVDAAPNPDEQHRVTVNLAHPVPKLGEGPRLGNPAAGPGADHPAAGRRHERTLRGHSRITDHPDRRGGGTRARHFRGAADSGTGGSGLHRGAAGNPGLRAGSRKPLRRRRQRRSSTPGQPLRGPCRRAGTGGLGCAAG
ncbi:hypothetical protein [Arthrobacter sp. Br18]|uniref:hypothetical protein n=1 Tax=Arthrobacter sp. Br18 TaxID=1312954 RepID=UPI0006889419|nr:hypothetical protein [Arthrobacter sp. Br18]